MKNTENSYVCSCCGKKAEVVNKKNDINLTKITIINGELFMNEPLIIKTTIMFCPTCTKNKLIRFLKRVNAKVSVS